MHKIKRAYTAAKKEGLPMRPKAGACFEKHFGRRGAGNGWKVKRAVQYRT